MRLNRSATMSLLLAGVLSTASVVGGFDRVPVSVERTVEGERAAVTWWIDDVAMMELEREEEGVQHPDPDDFDHQMCRLRIFSQLVHNTDLNPANIVITNDWKLWRVDFTRAFRVDQQIDRAELAGQICRRFYEAIRGLDEEVVRAELGPHLTEREMAVVPQGSRLRPILGPPGHAS